MHIVEILASLILLGLLPLKYILSKLVPLGKHPCPNEVTDEGIVMEVKPLQFWKQPSLNEVTDEGIVMEVKPLHEWYLLLVDYQYYTL